MSEFSVLDNGTVQVSFRGEPLKLSPLKIGQIPAFSKAIRPCIAAIAGFITSAPSGDAGSGGGEPGLDLQVDMRGIVDLFADYGDSMIDAVAVATRIEKATLQDTLPDEFLELVTAVVKVNVDFFGRAMAKATAENHRRLVSGPGPTPSSV